MATQDRTCTRKAGLRHVIGLRRVEFSPRGRSQGFAWEPERQVAGRCPATPERGVPEVWDSKSRDLGPTGRGRSGVQLAAAAKGNPTGVRAALIPDPSSGGRQEKLRPRG